MQRLSDLPDEPEAPQVNRTRSDVSHSNKVSQVELNNCTVPASLHSANPAPPKPPRTYIKEVSTTPSTFRHSRSNSVPGQPFAQQIFNLQEDLVSSTIKKKPMPAPRSVFPTFLTPLSRKRCPNSSTQVNTAVKTSVEDAAIHCSTPVTLPKNSAQYSGQKSEEVKRARKLNLRRDSNGKQVYYFDSSLDASYTSHKCYLTSSGALDDSFTSFSGPAQDREDIPWITTPPQCKLKPSRSLCNVNLGGADPRSTWAVLRSLTSHTHNKVDGGVEKKWTRSNSLRRPFHSSRHN
ncbi:uncharacterized protein LOC121853359, partial [Homarus americanus]|uniref:uncharacterized protein LOC121853359 n=1 Tax=Homarus americanus TaxID=6706 RepID=UPI001C449E1E